MDIRKILGICGDDEEHPANKSAVNGQYTFQSHRETWGEKPKMLAMTYITR
jgi:hypothetical protein